MIKINFKLNQEKTKKIIKNLENHKTKKIHLNKDNIEKGKKLENSEKRKSPQHVWIKAQKNKKNRIHKK